MSWNDTTTDRIKKDPLSSIVTTWLVNPRVTVASIQTRCCLNPYRFVLREVLAERLAQLDENLGIVPKKVVQQCRKAESVRIHSECAICVACSRDRHCLGIHPIKAGAQ